jgi:glycosyltransferase involved in cell wall biosynthesis
MHRGGTSATARALKAIGVPLGNDLHPAGDDNPKGFWEDRDCLALNEELLLHLGSAYDRLAPAWSFAEHDPAISALRVKAAQIIIRKMSQHGFRWGFKDPRTSRLLGFWAQVIQSCDLELSYVIALRNPLSVALSLHKRNGISIEKSYVLWLQHMVRAVVDTAGFPRLVVNYDLLIDQPDLQLPRMARALGLNTGEPVAELEPLNEMLDPTLRHSEFAIANLRLDDRVPDDVATAYEILSRAATDEVSLDDPAVSRTFEALDGRLRAYSPIFRHVNELEQDKIVLYTAIGGHDSEVAAIRGAQLHNEARIAGLSQEVAEGAVQIAALNQIVAEQASQIALFDLSVAKREQSQHAWNLALADKDEEIARLRQSLSERDARISSLSRTALERDDIEGAAGTERDTQLALLQQAAAESASRALALSETLAANRRQISSLQAANCELKVSLSWRITAPLRYVFGLLFKTRAAAPIPALPAAAAVALPAHPANLQMLLPKPIPAIDTSSDYVQDSPPPPAFQSDVRTIAFYLPQFHPIPENDAAWGKGFTEWTNVVRGKPEFDGHYQPHLPGELGFYDLRVKEVQRRQVALAKRYGIGAFCFYFYWFGGKTLLESPLRQYLENQGLDLPFCLCWANENWTREWDGLDQNVIIAQKHSPEDDIAFIEHVAQYMRDPRYLLVDGRPALLIYRPSQLPNGRETADRWRKWARENGLGELYLIYTQSAEVRDPADYGFDAATEFPPNVIGPPLVTDLIQPHDPGFSGKVYDWSALVERSRHYPVPGYKLFRGVCPSWDNTARRPGRGTTLLYSNPKDYREWLENAVSDTRRRFRGDERLIFVNAWNEWAEGAHLEPDRRYGYAWLQATRAALASSRAKEPEPLGRVVVVTHDAYQHGAQFIALSLTRELAEKFGCVVEVVCLGEGPLKDEFAKYGRVHDLAHVDPYGPQARTVASSLFDRGFTCAFVNTTVGGHFLVTLKEAGLRCIALVHELRDLILSYQLETQAQAIAEHADRVVFPAPEVRDAFLEFGRIAPEKIVIRPQGVLNPNPYCGAARTQVRQALRQRLGLPNDAWVVLGVGYGDLRKGLDYFLEIAARLRNGGSAAHFVWVGRLEPGMESHVATLAAQDPGLFHYVHLEGFQEDPAFYYAGADLFALTSREDPFPNVVLEAMAVGLPVVAFTGSGGSNQLIDEGVGENVPMGDCEAFADAIQRTLRDPDRRDAASRRALDLIAERYSFRHYVFDLLQLAGIPIRKVSVIVPSYNYEHYLADRLTTILSQTYPVYELIFLDDASSDNSIELARRLLAKTGVDWRIIANGSNSGSVFRQWKLGIEAARGEMAWIAEADDMSEPSFLATVVAGFDDPEVVISYCESKQIDEDGRVIGENYQDYVGDLGRERWQRAYVSEGKHEISNYLAVKNTIPNVSATVMRRGALLKVLSENADICEHKVVGDWKTYIYLLSSGRLAFFPRPLNLHRRHRTAVTVSAPTKSLVFEIQDMQQWVASRHAVSADVALTASSYLSAVRQQFGIK